MQQTTQITFRGMGHSDAIEQRVREKVAELERFDDRITGCHVTIHAPHHHRHKGNVYSVRVVVRVAGKDVAVGGERLHHGAHEDVYVAIRDVFDAAVRRIEDHARRRRGDVKRHQPENRGEIAKLFPDDEYGFVQMEDGSDVYFHANSVTGTRFDNLRKGDIVRVVLAEDEGEKGPQASAIIASGRHRAA